MISYIKKALGAVVVVSLSAVVVYQLKLRTKGVVDD